MDLKDLKDNMADLKQFKEQSRVFENVRTLIDRNRGLKIPHQPDSWIQKYI